VRTDEFHGEYAFDLGNPTELVAYRRDGGQLNREARHERGAARAAEPDGGGPIPDDVRGTKQLDQHDLIAGIDGGVHRTTEDGADVIAGAPGEWHPDADLGPIMSDVRDAAAGAPVRRVEVEPPAG
jgi:hypothetical protein